MWRRLGDERGAVGGLEALPFGVLIFVVGTLLVSNAWAVVDAKFAVAGAVREGARAFVEAPVGSDPAALARGAAEAALTAQGRGGGIADWSVAGSAERCDAVTVSMSYRVPVVVLPWAGGLGDGLAVTSTATELVDPLRSGLEGEATCVGP